MSQVETSAAPGRRAVFYGWYLVVVAWVLYGLQVAGFYSWGFYLPEMTKDLSLSRAGGGVVFGVATFCAGAAAPLVGMAITRFGLRAVMTAGFALSAIGYLATSRAQTLWQLLVLYGIFTAGTHAFATIVPTQTLASTWFVRYRARVLAVLMASGGIAAPLIYLGQRQAAPGLDLAHRLGADRHAQPGAGRDRARVRARLAGEHRAATRRCRPGAPRRPAASERGGTARPRPRPSAPRSMASPPHRRCARRSSSS